MSVRSYIATGILNRARGIGRTLGCELVVEVSDHSLHTSMEVPNTTSRAWDRNLYHRGQLFRRGYANPFKPKVVHVPETSELDEIDVDESNVKPQEPKEEEEFQFAETDGGKEPLDEHIKLITSHEYYYQQDQHFLSELVNPDKQWRLVLIMVAIALGLTAIHLMGWASVTFG